MEPPVARPGRRLAAVALGPGLLAGWLLIAPAAHADVVPGGLHTRVNGRAMGRCSRGVCRVRGGTRAGDTLFLRFRRFNAGDAIRRVVIDTRGQPTLVLGVTDPRGLRLGVPVVLSRPADVFWLSPGGLRLAAGSRFPNTDDLLLTSSPSLRLGGRTYQATTDGQRRVASLVKPPAMELDGLAGQRPVVLAGARLRVDGQLLLNSGLGPIRSRPVPAAAPPAALKAGGDLRLAGGNLRLHDLQARAGRPGDGRLLRLETVVAAQGQDQGTLRLRHSGLRADTVQLRAGAGLDLRGFEATATDAGEGGLLQLQTGDGATTLRRGTLKGGTLVLRSPGGVSLTGVRAQAATGSLGLSTRGPRLRVQEGPMRLKDSTLMAAQDILVEGGGGVALERVQATAGEAGDRGLLHLEAWPGSRGRQATAGQPTLQLTASTLTGHDITLRARGDMTLDSSSLSAGDPGNRGAIWLDSGETASGGRQSRGALTLTRSTLEGNPIVVQSTAAQTITASQLTAPKGLIHLEAGQRAVPQSAVNLRIAKSMFDVGVHALADLRRPVQSSIDFNGVTTNLPVPTPSIGLYATGSIDVSSETQLLASQLLGPIRKAYPSLRQADIQLDDTSGVVVIDANQSVRVRNSELRADASDNLAGNLFLRSQDGRRSAGVMIDRSTLSASGGAISGDIRISSSAGLNVRASRLVATGKFALEDAGRPGHPTWQKAFSGGEITLTNSSPSRAILILNSKLYAQQAASMTVLSDRSLAGGRHFGLSAFDSNDGPASIGGVVSVVSAGGIKAMGSKSLISVDSRQRSRGDLGNFGGVIRMVSTQEQPLVISQGAKLSARAGPALDPLSKPVSWGGEINLWSGGHLLLDRASLDAKTLGSRIGSPQAPPALAHPSVSRRHQGRIYLAARGDLRLLRSSLLATHPDGLGTDGPAVPPQVSLFSASRIRTDASDDQAACPGGCAAIVDGKTLRRQRETRLWGRSRRRDFYLLKPESIDRDLALDGGIDDPLGYGERVRSNFWRDRVVGVFTEGRSPVLIKGDLFGRSLTVYPLDVAETIVDRQAPGSDVGGLQKVLLNRPRQVPSVAPIPVLSLSSAVASIGPALPLLEPGQSMGKQEALALLQVSESQAALSLNKELGMPPLSTARFSIPRLQNSLRASMIKPRSERGGNRLPAYVPAMIRINASTLPDGERLQINQILVPPTGEIVAWSRFVSRAEFRSAVLAHRRQTMEPTSAAQGGRQHERLTQILLGPALPELKRHGVTALVLSLDRPLQAIPFAALPLEGRVLADTFSMAVTPALLLTDLGPRDDDRRTGGTLLAGAEQFGDGLAPLPMVQQELRAIGRLQSRPELLLNESFTTANLIKRLQQDSLTTLHLATHADFSAGSLNGGELFTASGKLAMPQLGQSLRARSRPFDFVFLSACRSALGDELSELGISGLALLAGATSALGTLWYVDNIASTAFAIQFYRLLRQGLSKDVALREVQQSFRQGLVRLHSNRIIAPDGAVLVDGISDADRWRLVDGLKHPYYWAGYVLSGSPW